MDARMVVARKKWRPHVGARRPRTITLVLAYQHRAGRRQNPDRAMFHRRAFREEHLEGDNNFNDELLRHEHEKTRKTLQSFHWRIVKGGSGGTQLLSKDTTDVDEERCRTWRWEEEKSDQPFKGSLSPSARPGRTERPRVREYGRSRR